MFTLKKHKCDTEYETEKADLKKNLDSDIAKKRVEYEKRKADLKKQRDICKRSPGPTETLTDTEELQKKLAISKLTKIAKDSGITYLNSNHEETLKSTMNDVLYDIKNKIPSKFQKYFIVNEMRTTRGLLYGIEISPEELKDYSEILQIEGGSKKRKSNKKRKYRKSKKHKKSRKRKTNNSENREKE